MVRVKKLLLIVLFAFFCAVVCAAEPLPDISMGIESYQAGNYEDCISKMKLIVKDDPTAVMGYYYLGLSYAKTGQKLLAIQNYNKVINLNSDKTMTALAKQGKSALGVNYVKKVETQLNEIEEEIKDEYNPILEDVSESKSVETPSVQPTQQSEPKTTQVIKASDYAKAANSAQNNPNAQPTNDDIVNAIRTLQKAGLLQNGAAGLVGGQNQMPIPMDPRTQQMNSMLMMMNNGNNNGNNMMQMLPYMNNGGKVDPQMMQMMLMNQMVPNFSSGNNNGGGY